MVFEMHCQPVRVGKKQAESVQADAEVKGGA